MTLASVVACSAMTKQCRCADFSFAIRLSRAVPGFLYVPISMYSVRRSKFAYQNHFKNLPFRFVFKKSNGNFVKKNVF